MTTTTMTTTTMTPAAKMVGHKSVFSGVRIGWAKSGTGQWYRLTSDQTEYQMMCIAECAEHQQECPVCYDRRFCAGLVDGGQIWRCDCAECDDFGEFISHGELGLAQEARSALETWRANKPRAPMRGARGAA
jgi:hypothetical protein